ncbi:PF04343 family protein [Leptospira weilii serovar Topaz str. LT2116]|uniref:PF04343 family protein n=1 Tax=Leptospira weilii serovar Topaz str. LT2116 TaxID=1088540 RepID=M3FIT8_9LEPT|nr:PF04343 family protein [Leptospira weilii serovar Topaz str. LT2116]
MMKYGQVKEQKFRWIVLDSLDYRKTLKATDIERLSSFSKDYSKQALVIYVYENYPFYAIKSEIAETILSEDQWKKVKKSIPVKKEPCLFTIGYEGRTVERYVTELIRENIQILCDVRRNPLSMKFGFSKTQLKSILEAVGIEYVHVPGLGVDSDKRQKLHSKEDYENLFFEYERTTLASNSKDLNIVANLFREKGRIALTCFEADSNCCHRGRTAKALLKYLPQKTKLNHL